MRLIADLLHQMQRRGIGGQYKGAIGPRQEQRLATGFALRALGDGDGRHPAHLQLLQHLLRLGKLPLAAVDKQDIRQFTLALF